MLIMKICAMKFEKQPQPTNDKKILFALVNNKRQGEECENKSKKKLVVINDYYVMEYMCSIQIQNVRFV